MESALPRWQEASSVAVCQLREGWWRGYRVERGAESSWVIGAGEPLDTLKKRQQKTCEKVNLSLTLWPSKTCFLLKEWSETMREWRPAPGH